MPLYETPEFPYNVLDLGYDRALVRDWQKDPANEKTPPNLINNFIEGTSVNNILNFTSQVTELATTVVAGSPTTPGGSNTQVQFNDASTFGGDSELTWNKTTNTLRVGSETSAGVIETPDRTSAGAGQGLTITTGNGSGSGNGGQLDITAGNSHASTGTGNGGAVVISSGAGGGTSGAGGAIEISAQGAATAGAGGALLLSSGPGNGNGNGGDINIEAGDAENANYHPGDIYLVPGLNQSAADRCGHTQIQTSGDFQSSDASGFTDQDSYVEIYNGVSGGTTGGWSRRKVDNLYSTSATPASTPLHKLTTNSTVTFEIKIAARRTGGTAGTAGDSAGYVRTVTYKNIAGVLSVVGAVQDSFTVEDQAAWDVGFTSAGEVVTLSCVGAANNNITWTIEVTYLETAI